MAKKPGGTLVGNLLRRIASENTGGLLGSGANRLPALAAQPDTALASQPNGFALPDVLKGAQNLIEQPKKLADNANSLMSIAKIVAIIVGAIVLLLGFKAFAGGGRKK